MEEQGGGLSEDRDRPDEQRSAHPQGKEYGRPEPLALVQRFRPKFGRKPSVASAMASARSGCDEDSQQHRLSPRCAQNPVLIWNMANRPGRGMPTLVVGPMLAVVA